MKMIFTLLFVLLSFLVKSQESQNYIKDLQVKITEFEKKGDTLNLEYAILLNDLGEIYFKDRRYSEAEVLFIKVPKIISNKIGEKNLDYAYSLNNLGVLYTDLGKFSIAEPLLLKALQIRFEFLGNNNQVYLKSLGNLAVFYAKQGKYEEAEPLFIEGLEIKKSILGEQNEDYLNSLYQLAFFYQSQGKYFQAEPLLLKILKIKKNTLGEKNKSYAISLGHLAILYRLQGRYSEAESLFLTSLEIQKEILGENNIDYITSLNNLASIYDSQNKYIEAEILYLKVLKIYKIILGDKKPDKDYSIYINNLAQLYDHQGNYTKSAPLYLEALNIKKETLGENNPSYAISLNNLALSYREQGKYNEAESLFLESLKIKKEFLGEKHPSYIINLLNLAVFYRIIKSFEQSSFYFEEFTKFNQNRILDDISNMSERDLISYINLKKEELYSPLSFLFDLPSQYTVINVSSFDNELLLKNLSIRNRERIKISIQKNGSKSLQDKYKQFLSNKTQINKLQELPLSKQSTDLNTIIKETEQLEKELAVESNTFSDFQKATTITFNEIKNRLKKNEVVIDLVTFNYFKKAATDSIVYAAFIVMMDSKFPKFISLFEEKQLEFLLSRNKPQHDSSQIDKLYTDESISGLFLKPLEKELENISTIYLSSSGLGHKIDFAALPLNEMQTFGQKYNLHILSSPAELVDYEITLFDQKRNLEFILYGGIDYNKSNSKVVNENEKIENTNYITELSTRSGISGFDYLNGTNTEISQIHLKAKQNGFVNYVYNEAEATEESIKALDGRTTPFVLHLATHGFFFPDPKQEMLKDFFLEQGKAKIYKASDDPMMRSGLLLAGANKYWGKLNEITTAEDGILTASEISNLDLSGCQLVVLSACETGLGEIKGSEGVFGLQRAFKMAGVNNIIMSLWKVPDAQTAELFDIFYNECFAGKTIHEAFKITQTKMKAKYSPYYWAGFVLLE